MGPILQIVGRVQGQFEQMRSCVPPSQIQSLSAIQDAIGRILDQISTKQRAGLINPEIELNLNSSSRQSSEGTGKIAVLALTADPITFGHIGALLTVIAQHEADRGVFITQGIHASKSGITPAHVRYRMVEAAVNAFSPLLLCSPLGLEDNLPGEVNVLRLMEMNQGFPNYSFIQVGSGTNSEAAARTQQGYLSTFPIDMRMLSSAFVVRGEGVIGSISSTQVRIDGAFWLVPASVLEIIVREGLYNLPQRIKEKVEMAPVVDYIKDNLDLILKDQDNNMKVEELTGGFVASVWLLSSREGKTQLVLKKVKDLEKDKRRNPVALQKALAEISTLPPNHYGRISVEEDIYDVYEYVHPVRKAIPSDVREVLVEMLGLAESYGIEHDFVFEDDLARLRTDREAFDPSLITAELQPKRRRIFRRAMDLIDDFLSNEEFAEKLKRLPIRIVYGDLREANILVGEKGRRVADWDSATFHPRIKEIANTIILSLIEGTPQRAFSMLEAVPEIIEEAQIKLTQEERGIFSRYVIFASLLILTYFCSYYVGLKDKKRKEAQILLNKLIGFLDLLLEKQERLFI